MPDGRTQGGRRTPQFLLNLVLIVIFAVTPLSTQAQGSSSHANGGSYDFNIPRQPVEQALDALAKQTGLLLLFPYDQVQSIETQPLTGSYSIDKALSFMLKDTGLSGDLTDGGVIVISHNGLNGKGKSMNTNKRKSLLASMIAMMVGGGQQVLAQEDGASSQRAALDEIIVTGTKRDTSLQDTAMSIAVLGGEEIEKQAMFGIRDYLASIPGVAMSEGGVGLAQLSVRGLGSSFGGDTSAGTYFGEVPLGTPLASYVTDMKLVDVERVEVLRGPQGTLYGSGALGGLIRQVPKSPDLEQFEGRLDTGFSTSSESNDYSHRVAGVINLPIIENELAMRIAAYRYHDAGYVDMISDERIEAIAAATGSPIDMDKDVGANTSSGLRASLFWKASDKLDLNLMLGTQQQLEDPGVGAMRFDHPGYTMSTLDVGDESVDDDFEYGSLVATYDAEWATLVSSTSYFSGDAKMKLRHSKFIGWASVDNVDITKEGLTQELRMLSKFDGPIQVIAGLLYEDVKYNQIGNAFWLGDLSAAETIVGAWAGAEGTGYGNSAMLSSGVRARLEQKAIFGEVSYQFSPEWELTFGARWFDYERINQDDAGTFRGAISVPANNVIADESDTVFKGNLSFTPNDHSLLYAQWSEGFRLGKGQSSPNPSLCDTNNDGLFDTVNGSIVPIDPGATASDRTENFELGGKFSLLDERLTLNAAVYRIDWSDLPLSVTGDTVNSECLLTVFVNGGEARSEGVELEMVYAATSNLSMKLSGFSGSAELQEDNSIGSKGDILPSAPDSKVSVGFDYNFEAEGLAPYLAVNYVRTDGVTILVGGEPSETYDTLNMRLGVTVNQFDIEFYGTNLTGSDEITNRFFSRVYRVKPRTIGVDLRYRF